MRHDQALIALPAESVTTAGDDDENGPKTDDPAEAGAFDPDVEIHEAMLARERAGGSYPDGDAVKAMEEPLRQLTSAAVLFSNVIDEGTESPERRIRSLLAEMMCRDATRLFHLYHGHPPRLLRSGGDFPSSSP